MNALAPEGFAAFVQRVRPVSLTPPMPEIHPDVAEWLSGELMHPDDAAAQAELAEIMEDV